MPISVQEKIAKNEKNYGSSRRPAWLARFGERPKARAIGNALAKIEEV
jgi:hypothetical protein